MSSAFWVGLKQRKLVQWAVAYVAAAFAFIQGLDVVAQRFGWPDRVEKLIILVLAVGFFVALVLAWYHGERGAQKVGGVELLIIALLLAIGGGALWAYARTPRLAAPVVASSPDGVKRNPGMMSDAIPDSTAGAVSSGLRVTAQTIPAKSVAVLPFANDSGDKSQQYFSDGLSQDLITALTQFEGLKVISRDSAFQFRGSKDSPAAIAAKLGVAHLLEGAVQHQGDEVRITATLVNASDGTVLWTQRYDKPYKDLFALQDAITHSVADALKAKLLTTPGAVVQSERPPSGNLAAWQAYQKGRFYYARATQTDLRKAIAAYTEATRLDPNYAAAYVHLSYEWNELANYLSAGARQQAYAKAHQMADTALQLAPNSARAHAAHGNLLQEVDFDWRGAQAEFQKAMQLAPNNPGVLFDLGNLDATLGRVQSAVALTRKALDGDPMSANWHNWLGQYLSGLGRLDEARQVSEKSIELQPAADGFHLLLAWVAILRGDAKAALVAAQQESDPSERRIALALATQIGANRKAADAALKNLIAKSADLASYQIADAYALRRDPDNMFQWLDHAWTARDPGIQNLLYDPLILRYQHDPRFAAFCKKVGLPTTTDAVAMKL